MDILARPGKREEGYAPAAIMRCQVVIGRLRFIWVLRILP